MADSFFGCAVYGLPLAEKLDAFQVLFEMIQLPLYLFRNKHKSHDIFPNQRVVRIR